MIRAGEPNPRYIEKFLAMSDIANLNLSSFEAVDKWGEHILSDTMALIATNETPEEIKRAVLMFWFDGREIEDLSITQSADAILLNTVLHLLHETNGCLDAIMRHVNIPPNYMPVFWQMEKDSHGTPTPNELEDMFQLEE